MFLSWGWSGHIQVQDQWSCSFVHVFIPFFCLFIYMIFGANLETPVTEKSVWVFLILFYFFLTVIPICLFWFAQSSLRRFLTTLVWAGSNVRGAKPVTVYFGKYEDKEEVLRQVNCHECPQLPKWLGNLMSCQPDEQTPIWSWSPLNRYFLAQCNHIPSISV